MPYVYWISPDTSVCVQRVDDNCKSRYGIKVFEDGCGGREKWWTRTKFVSVDRAQAYLDELAEAMGWSACP